jgi:hypothetical protein
MLEPFRTDFNQRQFSDERYAELLRRLDARTQTHVEFRVAETPVFLDRGLLEEMIATGVRLTHQLIDSPTYMKVSDATIPERFRVPHDNPRPNFMTVDFGLVQDENGKVCPKLVELQAFPSVSGYQEILCQEYQRVYGLDERLRWRLSGLSEEGYWEVLRRTIVGGHDPEQVVLMEVAPETQKTLADFKVYEQQLGIKIVDIAKVHQQGDRLFYDRDGVRTPIRRIFNRAIVDEMERKGIAPAFDYRDDLDVEWAGQPNWYFRISKFALPFLDDPSVPPAVFLDDWFAGRRGALPDDRSQLLLKPLYSFAGKGIQFEPTDADLEAIPHADRRLYLLQQRVRFTPVIRTPCGPTQAEVRIMYCWPDEEREMIPIASLVRMGRGAMMGVDHNRDQAWVGGSAAMFLD